MNLQELPFEELERRYQDLIGKLQSELLKANLQNERIMTALVERGLVDEHGLLK